MKGKQRALDADTHRYQHDRHDQRNLILAGGGKPGDGFLHVAHEQMPGQVVEHTQAQQQQTTPDGHNQQRQQQEHRQEEQHDGDFMQKLRLGLFGLDDTI